MPVPAWLLAQGWVLTAAAKRRGRSTLSNGKRPTSLLGDPAWPLCRRAEATGRLLCSPWLGSHNCNATPPSCAARKVQPVTKRSRGHKPHTLCTEFHLQLPAAMWKQSAHVRGRAGHRDQWAALFLMVSCHPWGPSSAWETTCPKERGTSSSDHDGLVSCKAFEAIHVQLQGSPPPQTPLQKTPGSNDPFCEGRQQFLRPLGLRKQTEHYLGVKEYLFRHHHKGA